MKAKTVHLLGEEQTEQANRSFQKNVRTTNGKEAAHFSFIPETGRFFATETVFKENL